MQRFEHIRRSASLLALSAGMLVASVACGTSTPAGTAASSVAATGSSSEPRPLNVSGAAVTGATASRCHSADLSARVGALDAGAGQRNAPLVLTNVSSRSCRLYGYVGLIMIDARGDVLRTRTRRNGSAHPQGVTLRPGASAHATLHWTVVTAGHETRCPQSARLIILPPDEVGTHLEIPFTAAPCDDGRIDVTPVAAGTHG